MDVHLTEFSNNTFQALPEQNSYSVMDCEIRECYGFQKSPIRLIASSLISISHPISSDPDQSKLLSMKKQD